jgi:pyridoxal phosphate enzyme (YggS family)
LCAEHKTLKLPFKNTTRFVGKSAARGRDTIERMTAEVETSRILRENLARVCENIAAIAARSGRAADQVTLVGVTKYVAAPFARLLAEAGLADLGESRPQELWRKADALADDKIRWHFIGHLQTNKVKRTLPLTTLIHSIDSLHLLQEIDKQSAARQKTANVLLEVNISGDTAKTGLAPTAVEPLLPEIDKLNWVTVRGLMAMSALDGDAHGARHDFAALRELRDRLQTHCPSNIRLEELSMGMSDDYEAAIAEGATLVRIGSALFTGLS